MIWLMNLFVKSIQSSKIKKTKKLVQPWTSWVLGPSTRNQFQWGVCRYTEYLKSVGVSISQHKGLVPTVKVSFPLIVAAILPVSLSAKYIPSCLRHVPTFLPTLSLSVRQTLSLNQGDTHMQSTHPESWSLWEPGVWTFIAGIVELGMFGWAVDDFFFMAGHEFVFVMYSCAMI